VKCLSVSWGILCVNAGVNVDVSVAVYVMIVSESQWFCHGVSVVSDTRYLLRARLWSCLSRFLLVPLVVQYAEVQQTL